MADDPREKGAVITATVYEAMWETYRDGERSIAGLSRRFNVAIPTAKKAIDRGWPQRGFRSLRDRAVEHDQVRIDQERRLAADRVREATDAWYKAGKQFNRVADNAVVFCIAALQQIQNLAVTRDANGNARLRRLTKWVRRRAVDVDANGNRTTRYFDEEVPLPVNEAVKLEAAVMKAAMVASAFKRLWPVDPDKDSQRALEGGPPPGLGALTEEQLTQFMETGQLPAGVKHEDVFGFDPSEMLPKKGKQRIN